MPLETQDYVNRLSGNSDGEKSVADFLTPKFDDLLCDVQTIATASGTAGDIDFTPYGNIASGSVQLAIQELDDEKAAKLTDSPMPEDNFVSITATGDIQDSGYAAADFIPVLTDSPMPDGNFAAISATGTIEDSGYSAASFQGNSATILLRHTGSTSNVTAAAGELYIVVPPAFNGWNVTRIDASVYTVTAAGATVANLIRRRAGNNVNVCSAGASITANTYIANSTTVDTNNDDLATGDILQPTCTATASPAAKGLSVTVTLVKP